MVRREGRISATSGGKGGEKGGERRSAGSVPTLPFFCYALLLYCADRNVEATVPETAEQAKREKKKAARLKKKGGEGRIREKRQATRAYRLEPAVRPGGILFARQRVPAYEF